MVRAYLSPEELKRQVTRVLRDYHRFLAVAYFTESRDREFWDYHKARLEELGYPLTRSALLKAAFRKVMLELANPAQAVKKMRSRIIPKSAESKVGSCPPGAIDRTYSTKLKHWDVTRQVGTDSALDARRSCCGFYCSGWFDPFLSTFFSPRKD